MIVRREPSPVDVPLHEVALAHRVLALSGLPTPEALPNIGPAVQRLLEAKSRQERILIVGDYDCDGATSTSVAMLGLSMLGFENLAYRVPNRFTHGYGLSPAIVELAQLENAPSLLLTVDNGVASVEGVDRATELGMDVIVTDHHLAPEQLPKAIAIVNPNLAGSQFIGKSLAGVGVIFYVRSSSKCQTCRFA